MTYEHSGDSDQTGQSDQSLRCPHEESTSSVLPRCFDLTGIPRLMKFGLVYVHALRPCQQFVSNSVFLGRTNTKHRIRTQHSVSGLIMALIAYAQTSTLTAHAYGSSGREV